VGSCQRRDRRGMIYKRKVQFYETDAQGVVHHSNYPRYFEEARGYYLEKIGYPYEKIRSDLNTDVVLDTFFLLSTLY